MPYIDVALGWKFTSLIYKDLLHLTGLLIAKHFSRVMGWSRFFLWL